MSIHLLYHLKERHILDVSTQDYNSEYREFEALKEYAQDYGRIIPDSGLVHSLEHPYNIIHDIEPQMRDIGLSIDLTLPKQVAFNLYINEITVGEVRFPKESLKYGLCRHHGHVFDNICRLLGLKEWDIEYHRFHLRFIDNLGIPGTTSSQSLGLLRMPLTKDFNIILDEKGVYTVTNTPYFSPQLIKGPSDEEA